MVDDRSQLDLVSDGFLELDVRAAVQLDFGEQVIDKAEEEGLVFIHLEHRNIC